MGKLKRSKFAYSKFYQCLSSHSLSHPYILAYDQVIFSMREAIPVIRPSISATAYLPTALLSASTGYMVMAGTHILARYDPYSKLWGTCQRLILQTAWHTRTHTHTHIYKQGRLHHLSCHTRLSSDQDAGPGWRKTLPRDRKAGSGFIWQHSSPRPSPWGGMHRQKRQESHQKD